MTISLCPRSSFAISSISASLRAEIPDIDVLLHAVFVYRFRDYHDASLDIPAKGYLCGALPVFLTDLCQHRMCKDPMVTFCERSPCFRNDAILFHQGKGIVLLEERVQFHLINCRDHFHRLAQIGKTCRIEVAHAYGFQFSFLVCFFHCTVCADIITHWLMDQVKVQIFKPKLGKGGLNCFFCFLVSGT